MDVGTSRRVTLLRLKVETRIERPKQAGPDPKRMRVNVAGGNSELDNSLLLPLVLFLDV